MEARMAFIDTTSLDSREVVPGYHGVFIHTDNMTIVHWKIEAGAELPEHSHPHEQIVNVIEGEFELAIDEDKERVGPGGVAVITSNVKHAGRALTACRIIDVFYPMREDYA